MRDNSDYSMKQSDFFKAFKAGGSKVQKGLELVMLKIKDYPPDAEFADVMPRHWQVGSFSFMSWLGTLKYFDIVCESGVYIFGSYRELRAGLLDLTTLAGLYNMSQLLTAVR